MINKNLQINPNKSIKNALSQISKTGQKCLVVVSSDNKLLGTLSDGDIRRSILKKIKIESQILNIFKKDCIYLNEKRYTNEIAKQLFIDNRVDLIPIVDKKIKLIDILIWEDIFPKSRKIDKIKPAPSVVIMAGGKGNRLKPFTQVLPKPLVPVKNKPFIQHITENFNDYGCKDFHVTVNFKSKIIKAFFEELNPNYKINFIDETTPLGTAGSLIFLKNIIKKSFFVSNSDVLIKADFKKIYDFHLKNKFDLTIVASTKEYVVPYGTCEIDEKGHLSQINEKPSFNFLVNTGLYIMKPKILELIPKNSQFHLTDLIKKLKKNDFKTGLFPINDDEWSDVGEWDKYYKTIKKLN